MKNSFRRTSKSKSRSRTPQDDAAEGSRRGLDLNLETLQDDAPQDYAMQDDATECYIPQVAATDIPGPSSFELPPSYESSHFNYNPNPFPTPLSPLPTHPELTPPNPTPVPIATHPPSQHENVVRHLDFEFENVPTPPPLSFPSHPLPSFFPSHPSPSFFPSHPSPSPSFFPQYSGAGPSGVGPSEAGAFGAGPSRAGAFGAGPFDQAGQAGPSNTQNGFEGGPQDTTLLVSYSTHVAKTIWENQNRARLMRIQTRYRVKEWSDILRAQEGAEWVNIARRSELMNIQDWQFREADEALISAFVERWYPETNSFRLPGGEISITLHDASTVLGFRVSGVKAHVRNLDLKETLADLYNLPTERLKGMLKGQSVIISKWRELMMELLAQRDRVNPELIAVGYLFELVGSTLFVNKSGESIPLFAFGLVYKPDVTHEFAWSAATLAYLYRHLGMASRADVSQIGGCLYLLHNFIWHYFPSLRGHINNDAQLAGEHFLSDRSRNRLESKLMYYRRVLDHTRVEHINWMPWRTDFDFTHGDISFSRYRGTLACHGIREAYHPDRLSRQFGWHQSIPPLDVIRPVSYQRERHIDLNLNKYEVVYSPEDDRWDRRRDALVPVGIHASLAYSMDAEYLDWHLGHTHPYLIHGSVDEANRRPHAELDGHTILATGRSIASILNEYRGARGRVIDERLENAICAMTDLFLGPMPPQPIPPLPRHRQRSNNIDPARHSDAGCYR